MKAFFILNFPFSDCQHVESLHSQLAILRLSTSRQHPLSISYYQTAHMKTVSIRNSPFLDCLHEDSIHYQFSVLRLSMWRHSPFSICHSHTSTLSKSQFSIRHYKTFHMNTVSIINSPFSDCPHADSLHSQFSILRLSTWRESPFSIRYSQIFST